MYENNNKSGSEKMITTLTNPDIQVISGWLMRWWRGILVVVVLLDFLLIAQPKYINIILVYWLFFYLSYFTVLEIVRGKIPNTYNLSRTRIIRIQFDLIFIATLLYFEPNTAIHWLWVFFAMPLLATLVYFDDIRLAFIIFLEISAYITVTTIILGGLSIQEIVPITAKCASLGLFTSILYYLLRLIPRITVAANLSETAEQLLSSMEDSEIVQLLAEAAKKGIPSADVSVVHLLGGENNLTLIPSGSTRIDLTALGKSPMKIGQGIAGWVIEHRESQNIPDVRKDPRFHPVPSQIGIIVSLLVVPLYIGKKYIGTISVHSSRRHAFDNRDKQFLETLAAQGALALANVELFISRSSGRQKLTEVLAASLEFDPSLPLEAVTQEIANIVCKYSGFNMAVVNLLDKQSNELVVMAMTGLPPLGVAKLHNKHIPMGIIKPLLAEEFRISQSYFIRRDRIPIRTSISEYSYIPDLGERNPGEWHAEDLLIIPIFGHNVQLEGYISVDDPIDRKLPFFDTVQILEVLARVAGTVIQNSILFHQVRIQGEECSRVARLLHLLNRINTITQTITNLERILYVFLTGITSGDGLRFNRACIFLIEDDCRQLVGRLGIGQTTESDARSRWESMVDRSETIDNYLIGIQAGMEIEYTDVHNRIYNLHIPIRSEEADGFSEVVCKAKLRLVYPSSEFPLPDLYIHAMEPTTCTAVVPLVSRDRVLGLLVCDNKFTNDKVESNIDLLENFAARIAAAIDKDKLVVEARELSAEAARRDAINAERRRLQDDLHEAMGMLTTGVKWEAEILKEELDRGNNEKAKFALERLHSVFDNAYQSLGIILEDLRDPILEQEGLVTALSRRADIVGNRRINVQDNLTERLPTKIEVILYRVGLEGMNNAIKHSGFKEDENIKITISVRKQNNTVTLAINDNGVGFDYNIALKDKSKYGLRSIRDKVREAGGSLLTSSRHDVGTELAVVIPLLGSENDFKNQDHYCG